jgi:hypothetical protein
MRIQRVTHGEPCLHARVVRHEAIADPIEHGGHSGGLGRIALEYVGDVDDHAAVENARRLAPPRANRFRILGLVHDELP